MTGFAVPNSADFRRIVSIPRRDPSELLSQELALGATAALKTAGGDRVFRPIQSGALVAAARSVEAGSPGAFFPIGVGEGKTDITFNLPRVLEASRAVLTVPGSLTTSKPNKLGKTERDFVSLRSAWLERPYGQTISYERLGRASGGELLEMYSPDLIVSDEAQALRNTETAACARVVEDYVRAERKKGRRVLWIVLSGTITGGSLMHYAHLAELTLGPDRTFLPLDEYDLDFWRRAVDAEVEAGARVEPGVLLEMPHERKGTQLQRARTAIQRRMHETEGVIASADTAVKASLRFNDAGDAGGGVPEDRWFALRKEWLLPNGEQCVDGFELHRHAREYACGYWSEWDPPPPPEWRRKRKRWAKIAHSCVSERLCNTEVEARAYVETVGDDELVTARDEWLAIRDTYVPNPVARWLSDATLEACVSWAKRVKTGGIIWTQHVPFGRRLAADFGIPYYGEEGLNDAGVYIEDAREPIICAAVGANYVGRNLQFKFSKNLMVSPYGSAERAEQNFGRTHRQLQPADEVSIDFLIVCLEHVNALRRARERAAAIEQLTKNPQRLNYGDWTFELAPIAKRIGSQWVSKIKDEDDADDDSIFKALAEGITT